jgi:hypothetical protein
MVRNVKIGMYSRYDSTQLYEVIIRQILGMGMKLIKINGTVAP